MKKLSSLPYIVLFLLALTFLKTEAQTPNIVVNEYFNEGSPTDEWTELLVTADHTNLVGYILLDNNGLQNSPQGGVKFKDIALWRDVREGTIIVVWHRNSANVNYDINPTDGYIESHRDDIAASGVFEKGDPHNLGSNYDQSAMSINASGDILQIRSGNFSSTNIHSLAHKDIPGTSFVSIPGFKTNFPGDCPDGSSNAILPGRTINDYTGDGKSQIVSGTNVTKGLPNRNATAPSGNYNFWEELREPEWPTIDPQVTVNATNVVLTWTPLPAASQTSIEGYVIFRSKNFPVFPPPDGYIFAKGVPIPFFPDVEVVDVLPSTASTYTDNLTIACGDGYEYRIYTFRYGKDNQNKDTDPFNARGRAYNELQFGSFLARKLAFQDRVTITNTNGTNDFILCSNGNVVLQANPTDAASYQWFKDGTAIPSQISSTYTATAPGKYIVNATNAQGCTEPSAEITITASTLDATFTEDVQLCETILTAAPTGQGYTYQWLDGSKNPISSNGTQSTYSPIQAGIYSVIVSDGTCRDTSAERNVTFNNPGLSFKIDGIPLGNTTIDFGTLGECESSKMRIFTVSTLSQLPLSVTLEVPPGYRAVPTTFKLGAQSPQDVQLFFEPTTGGQTNGVLRVSSECDSFKTPYGLTGFKTSTNIAAVKPLVEYPVTASCETQKVTEIVKIANNGNDAITFLSPTIPAPFTVIAPTNFPLSIASGDTLSVTVEYTPSAGVFTQTLKVPYISVTCTTEVNVSLKASTLQPAITAAATELDFKTLDGCSPEKDSTIIITNQSEFPLTIPAQQLDANFSIPQPVALAAKESKAVTIRFNPTGGGQVSSTVVVKADKCPDIANVTILLKGSSSAPAIAAIPDFKTITNCSSGPSEIWHTTIITTSPTMIESIDPLSPEFIVQGITVGQTINGTYTFNITFAPTADGVYEDSLLVKFAGCPLKEKILLKGEKTTLNFAFKETELDFGTMIPGDPAKTLTATLVNNGNDSVTVDKIDPPAPFKVLSTSLPLPVRLGVGDEIVVTFEYAPVIEADNSHAAAFSACFGQKTILLKGKAQYPAGSGGAIASIPVLRGTPGEIIELPITLMNSPGSFTIEKGTIESVSIRFSYNATLLFPESARAGDAGTGVTAATISEISPGVAEVVFTSGATFLKPGTPVIVNMRVLLGNSMQTPINFNSISIDGNGPINFTMTNGEFILEEDCAIGSRKGTISGEMFMMVSGSAPATGDETEITFETSIDGQLSLEIYDSFGRNVSTIFKGDSKAGRYAVQVPISDIADGVYHVVMQSGDVIKTSKLIIAR